MSPVFYCQRLKGLIALFFLLAEHSMKKKLIFDVDAGVDDAQALMVALAAPNVEILGIICCYGSTPLENVLKNTLCVLKVCKKLNVSLTVFLDDSVETKGLI